MEQQKTIQAGAFSAAAGAVILLAMMAVGRSAGAGLNVLGQLATPEAYARALRPVAQVLITVIALDNLFVIAYTGAFIGAAALIWRQARLLALSGLAFAILLALLDLAENAVTVHLARATLAGIPITPGGIAWLGWLGQVKYACGSLAVAFFGLGLVMVRPSSCSLTFGTAALFAVFPLLNAVQLVKPSAAIFLVIWMWLMLVASALLLWRTREA